MNINDIFLHTRRMDGRQFSVAMHDGSCFGADEVESHDNIFIITINNVKYFFPFTSVLFVKENTKE